MSYPGQEHCKGVKGILRYLRGMLDYVLKFKQNIKQISVFKDLLTLIGQVM